MRGRVVTIGLMVVGVCGCGGDDRGGGTGTDAGRDASGPVDSGGSDAGGSDGGPSDSGSAEDSGSPGTDAGAPLACSDPGPGGDCVLRVPVGSFGPLNDACLPRCSAETAAAYRACDTQTCRNDAVDADTTAPTPYYIGTVEASPDMDCATCVTYQEFHCFSLVCTSEVDDYVDHCIAGVDPSLCDPSIAAIDACLAALSPSEMETVDECMQSTDGPPGCFACE